MRIEYKLLRYATVEVTISLWCVIKGNNRGVHGLRDMCTIGQDRVHQLPVVAHHWTLTGGNYLGLGPSEADPYGKTPDLGRLVYAAGISSHIQPRNSQLSRCFGEVHYRVENNGRCFVTGLASMTLSFESDSVYRGIDFGNTEDVLNLVAKRG